MSSQSNINVASASRDAPFGVMVLSVGNGTDTLDECVSLFEALELELFGHARQVGGSLPSFSPSAGFDIFDDVVVHLGQLVLAVVVELLILFFKHSDISVSFVHVLEVRRKFGSSFERHQKRELTHGHLNLGGYLGEAHERLCQHIFIII